VLHDAEVETRGHAVRPPSALGRVILLAVQRFQAQKAAGVELATARFELEMTLYDELKFERIWRPVCRVCDDHGLLPTRVARLGTTYAAVEPCPSCDKGGLWLRRMMRAHGELDPEPAAESEPAPAKPTRRAPRQGRFLA